MPRGRHSYPPEFKPEAALVAAEAVQLVRRGDLTKTQIAKDLGVTIETLTKWAKQDEIDHGQQPGLSTPEAPLVAEDREELRRLRRENRVLREEREILKSRGLLRERDQRESEVKFLFVAREKAHHAITILCRVVEVSTSGYYHWLRRGPSARERRDRELLSLMCTLHQASRKTYGIPRMHAELTLGQGLRCSRKRVARLM